MVHSCRGIVAVSLAIKEDSQTVFIRTHREGVEGFDFEAIFGGIFVDGE